MDNLRGLQSVDERVENGDVGRDGKILVVDGTGVTLKLENGDYFGARVWVLGCFGLQDCTLYEIYIVDYLSRW